MGYWLVDRRPRSADDATSNSYSVWSSLQSVSELLACIRCRERGCEQGGDAVVHVQRPACDAGNRRKSQPDLLLVVHEYGRRADAMVADRRPPSWRPGGRSTSPTSSTSSASSCSPEPTSSVCAITRAVRERVCCGELLHCKNIRLSTDTSWRVFSILTEPVPQCNCGRALYGFCQYTHQDVRYDFAANLARSATSLRSKVVYYSFLFV